MFARLLGGLKLELVQVAVNSEGCSITGGKLGKRQRGKIMVVQGVSSIEGGRRERQQQA